MRGRTAPSARAAPPGRAAFARFVPMTTRWSDNDPYGHLNNVVYYELFDAAVNALLIEAGLLDPATSPVIGLVVESSCRFFSSLAFPDAVEVGVAVEHLGRSSVQLSPRGVQGGRGDGGRGGALHPCLCRARERPADADSRRPPAADGDALRTARSSRIMLRCTRSA